MNVNGVQEEIKDMVGQRTGRWRLEQAGLIFPAVALGVLAMIHGGVPPVLWGQQIAAFFVFALLANGLRHAGRRAPAAAWTALLLLVLALFAPGRRGGRRETLAESGHIPCACGYADAAGIDCGAVHDGMSVSGLAGSSVCSEYSAGFGAADGFFCGCVCDHRETPKDAPLVHGKPADACWARLLVRRQAGCA